jgi:hypothetical protein
MQGIYVWAALFFLSGAQAQAASSTDVAVTTSQEELDQVIVRGNSPKALAALRQEMIRLEDNFFDRYNELNTIKDFDVHCAAETSAGTKLKRRRCQANYMRDALELEAEGHADFIMKNPPSGSSEPPPLIGSLPPPAVMDIEIRRKEYQQNLIDVSKKNPELAQMLSKFSDLHNRYRDIQRSRGGTRKSK